LSHDFYSLTAFGWYLELFGKFRRSNLIAPIFLVKPKEPGFVEDWPDHSRSIILPGNHFTFTRESSRIIAELLTAMASVDVDDTPRVLSAYDNWLSSQEEFLRRN